MAMSPPADEQLDIDALASMSEDEAAAVLSEKLLHSDSVDDLANAGLIDMGKVAEAGKPIAAQRKLRSPQPTNSDLVIVDDPDDPAPPEGNQVVSDSISPSNSGSAYADFQSRFLGNDSAAADEHPASEPTFTPQNPDVPEADTSAAPEVQHTPAPQLSAVDMPDSDDSESGFGDKVSGWWSSFVAWLGRIPRIHKIAAAIIALILVFAVILTFSGGDDSAEQDNSPGGIVDDNQPEPDPGSTDTGPAGDPAPLNEVIDTMSGRCADPSTPASRAAVGADDEAWVCGRPGTADGAVLNIAFRRPVTVHTIAFTPGFNHVHEPAGDDEWERHRVISRVLVRIGGQQIPAEVVPSRETFELVLDEPIRTNDGDENTPPGMSITIQQSVPPSEAMGADSDDNALLDDGGDDAENATAMQDLVITGTVN